MSERPLWAPWRIEYIRSPKEPGCPFCRAVESDRDRENLVLHRGSRTFVVLNRYPYVSGHLMILPLRHVGDPEDLGREESEELWALLVRAKAALGQVLQPHGFNVGLNLGAAAGAGVADHLHLHVVPRWVGDNNFMPVLGHTRILSQHLLETYDHLAPRFAAERGGGAG